MSAKREVHSTHEMEANPGQVFAYESGAPVGAASEYPPRCGVCGVYENEWAVERPCSKGEKK